MAAKKPAPFKPGGTGRYMICPRSNTKGSMHGTVAKEIKRSAKGNLWFRCGCGFRGYIDNHDGESKEGMSMDEAFGIGAMVSM